MIRWGTKRGVFNIKDRFEFVEEADEEVPADEVLTPQGEHWYL